MVGHHFSRLLVYYSLSDQEEIRTQFHFPYLAIALNSSLFIIDPKLQLRLGEIFILLKIETGFFPD